ncbi:MAG: hypothetical protein JF625_23285 [Inquilinus limosus]|uniref:Uncharacterized protein n=1 Tax=Inquilinus limosus TaxID=171674 RepID=A0A952FSZ5_9PROT|nr:hypothetical protein [Inquilinus limosus]
MGMKKKWWNTASAPGSRSDFLNIVEALERAAGDGDSKSNVTITVNGATKSNINLSSDTLADIVSVVKSAFNDDD